MHQQHHYLSVIDFKSHFSMFAKFSERKHCNFVNPSMTSLANSPHSSLLLGCGHSSKRSILQTLKIVRKFQKIATDSGNFFTVVIRKTGMSCIKGIVHDVVAQIKISKNWAKICFKNALIRRLLIFFLFK